MDFKKSKSKKKDHRSRTLFDQVPGAIYQYRYYPDGHSCFPFSSRNIELVYEVTPEEVKKDAAPAFKRLHPADYDMVLESIQESKDSLTAWECDYRVNLPKRGERWLRGRATPEKLEDGSVLWHGFITDITDLKIKEAALRDSEARYHSVIEQITESVKTIEEDREKLANIIEATEVGTWQWNVQTGEVEFNERWAEIIGYTLKELEPITIDTWQNVLHPEDNEVSAEALRRHFEGETSFYRVDVRVRHKDGHWVWVHDQGKVISRNKEGKPLMMFGTHSDITERKIAAQKIERLLHEKTLILGEVNHRIKNNLMMVSSLIQLKDEELGPSIDLSDLTSRVSTLAALHEQLVYSEDVDSIPVRPYLEKVLNAAFSGYAKKIELENKITDCTIPSKAATSIGLIVNELATNAVKHGFSEGAPRFFSIALDLCPNGGQFCLTVSNSGAPIPDSVELDNPHTMGLQLITMLTAELRGTLTITRAPRPVFTFELPVSESKN